MALNIEDLQIEITASASKAVTDINKLASSLRTLSKIELDASKIRRFVQEVAELGRTKGLAKVANELTAIANATKTLKTYKMLAKGASAAGSTAAVTAATGTAKPLTQSQVGSVIQVEKMQKEVQKLGTEAEKTGKSFDRAAKGGLANFFNMVKRVALMRAIRSAIKFLAQAVREGFEMFVTWDREQNGFMAGTAEKVDKLTQSWTQLKGQIGALGGALANAVLPVITWIVDGLTKLVDLLQMVIRSLQGEYSYYKLIYTSAKATTGQAKELRRVLFGFDELNILPSKSGGGGTLSEGSWAYQEIPIDSQFLNSIADASNKLKELFGISDDGQKIIGGLAGAFGILIGGKALGGLLNLLPRLISGFKEKNTQLGKQSEATQTETGKVTSLATAFGLALGGATLFSKFLKENPLNVQIRKPVLDFTAEENAITNTKQFAAANPIEVKFNTTSDLTGVAQAAAGAVSLVAYVAANPIRMSITAPFSSIAAAFSDLFNTIQRFFNTHPVKMPVEIANGGMRGAGSYAGTLSSPVSNTYTAPWQGMSATDLVNYAESTGLNMSAEDKKVAAATVAAIFSAFATGGVLGLAGGAMSLSEIFNSIGLGAIFGFANGGVVPNTGSLFYAGEAGAEVVANLGHSTGVMNVSQMQEAVANGNLEVVNAIYAMANMITGAVNNKDFDVYMDSAKVGQSVTRYQFNQARRGITQGGY